MSTNWHVKPHIALYILNNEERKHIQKEQQQHIHLL